jgi:polysaccharide export outer membrane protein
MIRYLLEAAMRLLLACTLFALALIPLAVRAADGAGDYLIGSGDVIRISVFQNPELAMETRVGDSGTITFPLIGPLAIGGLTVHAAEQRIASLLRDGGYVVQPQVNILLVQVRGSQVAVLGLVGRPGRYPLETTNTKLSDMLATAGGIVPAGADTLVLTGMRDGKPMRKEIDIPTMFQRGDFSQDILLRGGDIIYVDRAPLFYIYGEVQRPGSYRIERGMTVRHALAQAGGVSLRGTERGLRLYRRDTEGRTVLTEPDHDAAVRPDDVLHIRESLF